MIWTLIFIVVFVVSFPAAIFINKYHYEPEWLISVLTAIVSGTILLFMAGFIISEHVFVDYKVSSLQAEREALVYQMDNRLFLGDALGEYNKKIISQRLIHENPWTSWFQGDYIYEVDPIELE